MRAVTTSSLSVRYSQRRGNPRVAEIGSQSTQLSPEPSDYAEAAPPDNSLR